MFLSDLLFISFLSSSLSFISSFSLFFLVLLLLINLSLIPIISSLFLFFFSSFFFVSSISKPFFAFSISSRMLFFEPDFLTGGSTCGHLLFDELLFCNGFKGGILSLLLFVSSLAKRPLFINSSFFSRYI